ncbi:MAG TPA: hypothetical protein VKG38_00465, partial [Solirubrobacteraceae bacterium]|nr:hypothetical protein [Solirubrobacteraceae bacterium]
MLARGIVASLAALALLAGSGSVVAQAGGPAGVTTAGYGDLRDNWDPNEPALNPSAVHSGSFGKLFASKLKGAI